MQGYIKCLLINGVVNVLYKDTLLQSGTHEIFFKIRKDANVSEPQF